MNFSKKKTVFLGIAAVFFIASIVFVFHIIYVRKNGNIFDGIEFSKSFSDEKGELLQVFLTSQDKYRIYKPVQEFPAEFLELLLLQEDKYFYSHHGINFVSIVKAFWETYVKKSRRIGASTITMQVAKLKYNLYTKNISGKIRQIFCALYLEMCFSKEEILDAYVNLAPCGKNIEGFESAAWFYFNKNVNSLNLSENIMICVLPQNPAKRTPSPNNTPSELISARKNLFKKWAEKYPNDADKEIFMDIQMSVECRFPNEARHFTEMLSAILEDENSEKADGNKNPKNRKEKITKKNQKSEKSYKNQIRFKTVKTSINLEIQHKCEEIFSSYISQNKNFGIKNGAILLLDRENMSVVANIGSANYYDESIQGYVNATTSKRSPGSALKPFVYALAVEQGKIHYRTMLKDTPQTFNEYAPDNYGSVFKGPVQAWFALVDSRNIPAIYLNRELKERNLYDFMKEAGITKMKSTDWYGLSVVLGTCDVTMLELAKMYGILANNGFEYEINFTPKHKNLAGKRLLSAESAFIVKKMLEKNVPPNLSKAREAESVPIAYKTGTSIGFKDAWSVGFFDRYILVVWIGNFDGQGNNSFLGRKTAAPLFFDIAYSLLHDIPKNELLPQENPPENCMQIPVCAVSGSLPTENCAETELAWFIPGVSPIEKCKIHRKINVDTRTGYRTDETPEENPNVKSVIREFWQSDLLDLFEQAGLPRIIPPDYPSDDLKFDFKKQGFAPEITSLLAKTEYVFRYNDATRNKIVLCANADADTTELMWFCEANFIGRSKPGEIFEWEAPAGKHEITVTDKKGRSDSVEISVIFM